MTYMTALGSSHQSTYCLVGERGGEFAADEIDAIGPTGTFDYAHLDITGEEAARVGELSDHFGAGLNFTAKQ